MDEQNKNTPENKPENNEGIKINFNPVIPGDEEPKLINLNINKADLKEPKKGGLFGMFGKKTAPGAVAKASTAWDTALDTESIASKKPEANPVETPKEAGFFIEGKPAEEKSTSQLLENITLQKSKVEAPKIETLLGKTGSMLLQKNLEEQKIDTIKKKLRGRKMMVLLAAAAGLIFNGYFLFQLSPSLSVAGIQILTFDNNLLSSASQTNSNLLSVQTNINKYNFLGGELNLNQFTSDMVKFLDGVDQLSNPATINLRGEIENELAVIKEEAPKLLDQTKKYLAQPITASLIPLTAKADDPNTLNPELQFQSSLRSAITQEKSTLLETARTSGLTEAIERELLFLDNSSNLVGNAALLKQINAITPGQLAKDMDEYQNVGDPAQKARFKASMMAIIGATKNPLATVSTLKSGRVKWTEIVDKFMEIAKKINVEHNSGANNSNSILILNSFDLSSIGKKISLSGMNKTNDGTNREVVTFLIEALEDSPQFKNVNNRTFPLSKAEDQATGLNTYSMNFRLDMEIEEGGFDSKNAPLVSFSREPVEQVKRSN